MIGTLLRKQLREQFSFVKHGKKKGARTKAAAVFLALVLAVSYLSLGFAGFGISILFSTLILMGKTWLYFAMLGMMAIGAGLFGSVFVTYSTIYKAKDNELLLSMPIAPWKILFARMATVFLSAVMFEAVVLIPAMIQYFIQAGFSWTVLLQGTILWLASSALVLALSCLLAYLVALVASHIRNKQLAIAVLTLVLLSGYYYVYFQINDLLQQLLVKSDGIGAALTKYVFPIYAFGRGHSGEWLYTLAFVGIAAAVFGLAYFLLSKTFIRIATLSENTANAKAKAADYSERSLGSVLLSKEMRHLSRSSAYMLNGGLGSVVMLIGAAALLINGSRIREGLGRLKMIPLPYGSVTDLFLPLLGTAILFLAGMNNLTAPSISIEGKQLWILRSMPIEEKAIIRSKLAMHLILTLPPVLLLAAVAALILELVWWQCLLVLAFAAAVVFFFAYFGMSNGLRFPILDWDNETVAVKSGAAVTLTLFSSWGFAILFGGLYILAVLLLHWIINPVIYFAAGFVILAVLAVLLRRNVYTKGAERFSRL